MFGLLHSKYDTFFKVISTEPDDSSGDVEANCCWFAKMAIASKDALEYALRNAEIFLEISGDLQENLRTITGNFGIKIDNNGLIFVTKFSSAPARDKWYAESESVYSDWLAD